MNEILEKALSTKDVATLARDKEIDEQSKALVREIYRYFNKRFQLTDRERDAFSRLCSCVKNREHWDSQQHRNFIFKAANSLGIDLPSSSF